MFPHPDATQFLVKISLLAIKTHNVTTGLEEGWMEGATATCLSINNINMDK